MYVDHVFTPDARRAARAMVAEMRGLLQARIGDLDWLSPSSRQRAVSRLNETTLWIGYPDRLDDFGTLQVRERSAVANQLAARRHAMDRRMSLVGSLLDRERWVDVTPVGVEGSYMTQNALLITAGMLQPPFFDLHAEPAANFGKIGQVIGHELTHASVAHGGAFDRTGRHVGGWSGDEVHAFIRSADAVVRQYDQFVIVDSIRQNGRATLNENVGDIGGLYLAWLAFERAMQKGPRNMIDGFTPEQRFFIAYAQGVNTDVERAEAYRTQRQVDEYGHSVAKWRVNGPLAHLSAFAAAFGCKEGDPMVLPTTLRWTVW